MTGALVLQFSGHILILFANICVQKVPATVDGMLGGYGKISSTDIMGSKKFLDEFVQVEYRSVYYF